VAESKKYYWLKLKRDFFKRHDIRIIEEMPNGKDYILFYLKLLLESIDHEGNLRFSETIPYNEQMLSVVTNTNVDIVRSAMKIFTELNMMEVFDDQTIYMTEVDKLIGSAVDNDNATRQRRYREKQKKLTGDSVTKNNASVTDSVTKNNESKRIEKDTDIDIEKEGYKEASPPFKPKKSSNPFLDLLKEEGGI
jgi:predicted phage replisome organizer